MKLLLDPGHEHAFGLMLLLPAPTGVVICHQVGGYAVELREAEGFLIPLAGDNEAQAFSSWFMEQFGGWVRPDAWTDARYRELDAMLGRIVSYGEDDARSRLSLDWARRTETAEGWIPVTSALGPAILIFENND